MEKSKSCKAILDLLTNQDSQSGPNITMIGNEKFEPLTLWNDNELRYRIIASH